MVQARSIVLDVRCGHLPCRRELNPGRAEPGDVAYRLHGGCALVTMLSAKSATRPRAARPPRLCSLAVTVTVYANVSAIAAVTKTGDDQAQMLHGVLHRRANSGLHDSFPLGELNYQAHFLSLDNKSKVLAVGGHSWR